MMLSVAACGQSQTRVVSSSANVEIASGSGSATAHPAVESKFCVPTAFREAELEFAQPEGDDDVICAKAPRSCVAIDRSANYRTYHSKPTQPAPPAPSAAFYRASSGGRLSFSLVGGERTPHGARGTITEAVTHRVVKSAPIDYDEHLDNLGWIGDGIVLGTRVDEGPGCVMTLYQPLKKWPQVGEGVDLGDCFGGNVMLQPTPGTLAVVDATGSDIKFVDEVTLAVDSLEIGHGAYTEMGTRVVAWLETNDSVLVLAYGSPITGDVARVDVKRRKVLSVSSPAVCK